MYVWIANTDQIFFAEVVNNGDGTLTAVYESSFPGHYSVYIEVVTLKKRDQGVPIVGSPFGLTVEGNPTINIDELPVCGTEEEDIARSFWRPGTWVSSILASASHGVMRDGWVFQPKSCVYDTFSYEDLMLLAERKEPMWILILGGSVQRGVFLNLVDMALAQGQKDNFRSSAISKCWGYADIKVGNLRLTYQASGLTHGLCDIREGNHRTDWRAGEDFCSRLVFSKYYFMLLSLKLEKPQRPTSWCVSHAVNVLLTCHTGIQCSYDPTRSDSIYPVLVPGSANEVDLFSSRRKIK